MKEKYGGSAVNQQTILDHPVGLFVLFFTEMWERFSYYGMRALLVLFLTSSLLDGGWAWERDEALQLYGFYTGLVYLTPIIGGFLADKFLGYRNAVTLGALIMTIGHASLAFETPFTFYLGLLCLILGNGLFKPNISSIVGQLYHRDSAQKDSAYTIFYMGINAGAFLGILLCGYVGEMVGWSYGFGLAGVFMFFGMLQFWFAQKIFGDIGLKPTDASKLAAQAAQEDEAPANVVRDRLFVIGVFAFFTIFFWMAFEQAGGSMTIFAADYTDRTLTGGSAQTFFWINTLLTIVPLAIVTWVLLQMFGKIFKHYPMSNVFLGASFLIIWGIALYMLYKQYTGSENLEIPASWFGILNSFFIIAFAPIFSKIWEKNPGISGPVKFALGLILLGLGFGILAYGSMSIEPGAKTASVSIMWLILAYLLHTLGELCLSPVGLSYVSKLAPARLVGMMFGFWFVANFVANTLAGLSGSFIDKISETYSMSTFFLIFTLIPIGAGLLLMLLNPMLKRKMHGIT
jgi:POT family proton-dependent oligopeptide transporter